jgi:hypothetical protein
MKHQSTFFLVIPLLATLSFMAPKKRSVAFEATYTTTKEVLDPAPMLKQRITGTGKSTQLDISKFVAVSTQNTSTPPPFRISGTSTFYSDNGDVFYTTFAGTSTPDKNGTLTVEMTSTITGGTGKFEHATGSITGKTIVDPKKPTASIDCKGNITLVK